MLGTSATLSTRPLSQVTHVLMMCSVHAGNQTAKELQALQSPPFQTLSATAATLCTCSLSQITHRLMMVSVHAGNQTAKELQAFAVATFPDIVSRIS